LSLAYGSAPGSGSGDSSITWSAEFEEELKKRLTAVTDMVTAQQKRMEESTKKQMETLKNENRNLERQLKHAYDSMMENI